MEIKEYHIQGPLLLKPNVFQDERGYFFESFNSKVFNDIGINEIFNQDNQSLSSKGVLRGLHFQNPPYEQGKLVRVIQGAVRDVAVDIRIGSPTYGEYIIEDLTSTNKLMMWIPPGFAHGFLTLEDETIFLYKCTNLYNKESESGIHWNDETIIINWGFENPLISDKDKFLPLLKQTRNLFKMAP